MPPIVMYVRQYDSDDIIDPGVCTMCGSVTSLLIAFRVADLLVDCCGNCLSYLQTAYDRMTAERMAFKMRGRS